MKALIWIVVVSLSLHGPKAWVASAADAKEVRVSSGPSRTTLANPAIRYTVPRLPYVILQRGALTAVVVDNRAVDDPIVPGHRAGYHGIASLTHRAQSTNVFVPAYAGLNFEHIHDGTTQPREVLFEPRHAPMELRVISDHVAELYQPPTPHWGLESSLRYELLKNDTMEVTFECIPRRVTWKNDFLGLFWASYINAPESLDIHFLKAGSSGNPEWVQGTSPEHGTRATHRSVLDNREFPHDEAFPLTLVFNFSEHRFAEPWSYGLCRGMALAQVFREQDQVRLSQSPSGGGTGNPAWDFQWFIPNPKVGERYQLIMHVVYTPVASGELAAQRDAVRRQVAALLKR